MTFQRLTVLSLNGSEAPPSEPKVKRYRCKFCQFSSAEKTTMGRHYDTKHGDLIPGDTDGYRYFYYLLTKKERGSCVICHRETPFNRATMKYSRFCSDPKCKQVYRDQFKDRMIGKYGKIHLLDDPEIQKKMLAGRRISGTYDWSNGKAAFDYVGSYERDFLHYLDTVRHWQPTDLMAPSPHIYRYEFDGKEHFYIPDFFIPSLSLEIEIKDDGSAKNISEVSREKDRVKDELMRSNENNFRYLKIVNKNYGEFDTLTEEE